MLNQVSNANGTDGKCERKSVPACLDCVPFAESVLLNVITCPRMFGVDGEQDSRETRTGGKSWQTMCDSWCCLKHNLIL